MVHAYSSVSSEASSFPLPLLIPFSYYYYLKILNSHWKLKCCKIYHKTILKHPRALKPWESVLTCFHLYKKKKKKKKKN
ncbi:hypothetical protein HanRHA438_Chr08g0356771 [Helianthus annuus]|nr:hypothetical protein HanIR_Chr08g0372641 [Helianthus annuus]KAJ0898436.1 hypothetical protein HanRHA438_Chr08g0356771 [Helianthus annuus]